MLTSLRYSLQIYTCLLYTSDAADEKDIKGPLPQAQMMPTGGVDKDNVADWIKAGVVAVGAGSSLTKGAKTGDYNAITETAKEFIANIKAARAELNK